MTYFLGNQGNVRMRRTTLGSFSSVISADDINTSLNRIGFDGSLENILTGDRIDISTTDARGLICFAAGAWYGSQVQPSISAYVNVNAAGGLRFFTDYTSAVNNVRASELAVAAIAGEPLAIDVTVKDSTLRILGDVTSYSINTDREAIDTTSLSDKFRQQYSAGLISGSGSIDCLFNYKTAGITNTSLLLLQLIQRVELGSSFDCALYLIDKDGSPNESNVFYEFTAVVTKSGITARSTEIITCSIDFVTSGDIRLLVGEPAGYVLKEDDDRIIVEPSLDFLLQEATD